MYDNYWSGCLQFGDHVYIVICPGNHLNCVCCRGVVD